MLPPQMLSSRQTAGKLAAIATVIVPIILIGSIVTARQNKQPLLPSLYEAYTVIANVPGADATGLDRTVGDRVVLSLLYMCHLVLFATLLGVVIDDFTNTVESLRAGSYTICERNHTVVLNWNANTPSLLRQMAVAREERRSFSKPVVVLADMDKSDMDDAVAEALGEELELDVITRQGCPYDAEALETIAAGNAREIIVLQPDSQSALEADTRLAATLAALEGLPQGMAEQNVVVQSSHADSAPFFSAAVATFGGEAFRQRLGLVPISAGERAQRLLAQSAMQPGMITVYNSVLMQSKDSAEFYIKELPPSMAGWTYGCLRRGVQGGVLVGYFRGGEFVCNPPDGAPLQLGDKAVLLTQDDDMVRLPTKQPAAVKPPLQHPPPPSAHGTNGRKVVVLGWPHDAPLAPLAGGVGDFSTPGTHCTVVGTGTPPDWRTKVGNARFRHVSACPEDVAAWSSAVTVDTDAVIMGPWLVADEASDDDADAHVVAYLLQLSTLAANPARSKPLHVVASIRKPRTQELVETLLTVGGRRSMSVDLMQPANLLSGIVTQVAAQPQLVDVFAELVSAETTNNDLGAELVLQRGSRYGLAYGQSLTFAEITEAVRGEGDTVIGVLEEGGVATACRPSDRFVLQPGSRLVTITQDYARSMMFCGD